MDWDVDGLLMSSSSSGVDSKLLVEPTVQSGYRQGVNGGSAMVVGTGVFGPASEYALARGICKERES